MASLLSIPYQGFPSKYFVQFQPGWYCVLYYPAGWYCDMRCNINLCTWCHRTSLLWHHITSWFHTIMHEMKKLNFIIEMQKGTKISKLFLIILWIMGTKKTVLIGWNFVTILTPRAPLNIPLLATRVGWYQVGVNIVTHISQKGNLVIVLYFRKHRQKYYITSIGICNVTSFLCIAIYIISL